MGKITVDNGGELKPTQGLTYPRLEVAFDARIMQYKILRYRDDRTTSTDQVNTPYASAARANSEKTRLLEEFNSRQRGHATVRKMGT
jgi:hypothetical protein